MPVVEIVKTAVLEAYKADPSVLKPALEFLSKVDGCLDLYYGVAEEDGKTFFLIVVWETIEHHRALQRTPGYPDIIGLSAGADSTAPIEMNHVEFNNDFARAFSAPVTELVRLALKQGAGAEKLLAVLGDGGPRIDEKNGEHAPASWGQAVEDGRVVWFVAGWESVQAHKDIIHGNLATFAPFIGGIGEVAESTVLHAKLSKHVRA